MQTFAWAPTGAESLLDFNARVEAYCTETVVLDITPTVVQDTILLSLTEIEDVPVEAAVCLIPQVVELTAEELACANGKHAELAVEKAVEAMREKDSDEEPFAPFKTLFFPRASGGAFCVVLVNGGEVDPNALSEEPPGRPDPEDGTGAIPPARRR